MRYNIEGFVVESKIGRLEDAICDELAAAGYYDLDVACERVDDGDYPNIPGGDNIKLLWLTASNDDLEYESEFIDNIRDIIETMDGIEEAEGSEPFAEEA